MDWGINVKSLKVIKKERKREVFSLMILWCHFGDHMMWWLSQASVRESLTQLLDCRLNHNSLCCDSLPCIVRRICRCLSKISRSARSVHTSAATGGRVRVCTSVALFPSQCEMKWKIKKTWIRCIFNKWVDWINYASFVGRWRYRQHTITWPGEAANQEQNKWSPWQRTAWQVSWEHEERSAGITFSWASWNCPLSSDSTGHA